MPRLTVRLTDDVLHQVEALAAHRGCTVSDVLRDALTSTAAPPSRETCTQTLLHHWDQRFTGLEAFVLRSAPHRPVAEKLGTLLWVGWQSLVEASAQQR